MVNDVAEAGLPKEGAQSASGVLFENLTFTQ
jgi:hypothetical protein